MTDEWEYRLIDGNWTYKASGYCTYYRAYLTDALMRTHGCLKKNCYRLRTIEEMAEVDFEESQV